MLIPFFEWLRELGMPGAALMGYVTYRAVMAFIFAFAVTLMIGGKIINLQITKYQRTNVCKLLTRTLFQVDSL